MKPVKELIEDKQKQLIKQRTCPSPLDEIFSQEFLRLPLSLLYAILFNYVFTKRQIKILLFIARFSIGCRRSTARLKQADFILAGIHPSDIKRELLRLKTKGCIGWNREDNRLWITSKLLGNSLTKQDAKVGELLSRNLVKRQYCVGVLPTQTNSITRYKGIKHVPIDTR